MRVSEIAKKVLIAAQDPRVAGLIQQYLLQKGYEAECEFNLDVVLERIMNTPVDLLIVDGEMPEKVLGDFVETVAGIKPELQMIAVGISDRDAAGKMLSAFVAAFVEKPFSIYDISKTIEETLN